MKALVFETPERPTVIDKPVPDIKDTEVLVKTRTVGICHSDYEMLAGRYIIPIAYPVTPGQLIKWTIGLGGAGASVSLAGVRGVIILEWGWGE